MAYNFSRGGYAGGKKAEASRVWEKIIALERQLKIEASNCKGNVTQAYKNMVLDMAKLKVEFEKINGKGVYNPNSLAHGEKMTRNKVLGDALGKSGPDTNHGLEE